MPWIDLDKYESVADYIKKHLHADAAMQLLDPLPKSIRQHGQTCKLYALSVVMEWMHSKYADLLPPPPPARKCDRILPESFIGRSLRKQAKEDFGSEVGEIYDYRTLLALAKQNGFNNARVIESAHAEYITNIKNEIDKGNAPIIFYDVSEDGRGMPIKVNSQREHAAVLAGYFTHARNNELYFIMLQWGDYYAVNARKLAASANQLSITRAPEYFYKENGDWDEGSWLYATFKSCSHKTRFAYGTGDLKANFRNKIIILDAPEPVLKLKNQ